MKRQRPLQPIGLSAFVLASCHVLAIGARAEDLRVAAAIERDGLEADAAEVEALLASEDAEGDGAGIGSTQAALAEIVGRYVDGKFEEALAAANQLLAGDVAPLQEQLRRETDPQRREVLQIFLVQALLAQAQAHAAAGSAMVKEANEAASATARWK